MAPSQLAGLKAVLLDLSGTLHVGQTPTPGAVAALGRLRQAQLPLRFCSNTTKDSSTDLMARLLRMGFEVCDGELLTSLSAAREAVVSRSLKPYLMLSDSARKDFKGLEPAELSEANSVVVGLAPEAFTYDKLNTAFRLLKGERLSASSPAPASGPRYLIAAHAGLRFQDEDSALSLGPGPFVQALSAASGVEPEIIGKPTRGFLEMALRTMESDGIREQDWCEVAIVGDDVKNDLSGGATELGLRRFLVKTGKYRAGDERQGDGPDGVWDSFAALVDDLLATRGSA